MRNYTAIFRDEYGNIIEGVKLGTYNSRLGVDDISAAVTKYAYKLAYRTGITAIDWELYEDGYSDRSFDRDGNWSILLV